LLLLNTEINFFWGGGKPPPSSP